VYGARQAIASGPATLLLLASGEALTGATAAAASE